MSNYISSDEVMKQVNAKAKLGLPLDERERSLFLLFGDHEGVDIDSIINSHSKVVETGRFIGAFDSMERAIATSNLGSVRVGDRCIINHSLEYQYDGTHWVCLGS